MCARSMPIVAMLSATAYESRESTGAVFSIPTPLLPGRPAGAGVSLMAPSLQTFVLACNILAHRLSRSTGCGTAGPLPDPVWFVASVKKAFQILRAFEARQRSLSLTEIAEVSRLDKSAAQRFTYYANRAGAT